MQTFFRIFLIFILFGIVGYAAVVNQQSVTSEERPLTVTPSVPTPTQTPISTPIPNPSRPEFKLENLIYPGSVIEDQTISSLNLTVDANPMIVTDWYEEQVSQIGFGAISVARANANGQVQNKISAANSEYEIMIEITNAGSATSVKISLN